MKLTAIDGGLLVLRLGLAGFLLSFHGLARLGRAFGYFAYGEPWTFIGMVESQGFPYPLVFASLSTAAESVAVLLVGLGIWTRVVAFVVSVHMAVAVRAELLGGGSVELPGLYLLIALTLVVAGGGRLRLMRLFGKGGR